MNQLFSDYVVNFIRNNHSDCFLSKGYVSHGYWRLRLAPSAYPFQPKANRVRLIRNDIYVPLTKVEQKKLLAAIHLAEDLLKIRTNAKKEKARYIQEQLRYA